MGPVVEFLHLDSECHDATDFLKLQLAYVAAAGTHDACACACVIWHHVCGRKRQELQLEEMVVPSGHIQLNEESYAAARWHVCLACLEDTR